MQTKSTDETDISFAVKMNEKHKIMRQWFAASSVQFVFHHTLLAMFTGTSMLWLWPKNDSFITESSNVRLK